MRRTVHLIILGMMLMLSFSGFAEADRDTLVFGKLEVEKDAEYIDLGDNPVRDWKAFYAFLDSLPMVKKVDMFATQIRITQIDALTERYPNIEFGWTMRIAEHLIRTDWTAFSTLHYSGDKTHSGRELSYVRYCKNLRALDLGHNGVDDISFLYELPELRVLIMAANRLTDISPIASLKHLEYLELFSNHIVDITALKDLDNLMDLNLSFNDIGDLSPLYGLKNLRRLWLYNSRKRFQRAKIPEEEIIALQEALPECHIDTKSNPTAGGWRDHPHFDVLHRFFRSHEYEPFADSADIRSELSIQTDLATYTDIGTDSDLKAKE